MTARASYDVILRGGEVVDGTGGGRFTADVAIIGDRIARIGDLDGASASQIVDARGLVVAPGFIDSHTHDDRALLSDRAMRAKVSQGVTSVVTGNCGISLAPAPRPVPQPVTPPLDLLDATGDWYRHRCFADYVAALEAQPAAVNCIPLVGHTTLRAIVMSDLDREASDAEIEIMGSYVREALEAGAFGVSTGLAYAPARAATTREVIEVCRALKEFGGLYCTHMRDEADATMQSLEETFEIGRAVGVPVLISHHKLAGARNHGRSVETLRCIEAQMERQPVCLDCYPYAASSTVLTVDHARGSPKTLITWSKGAPEHAGRDLADVIDDLGLSLEETVARLQPAGAVYFRMDEGDVRRILAFGPTMIGSDGLPHDEKPHPRLWGTFARVLGRYSRDLSLFSLEAAVHKMTGLTAKTFGLEDRGVVREGAFADLTLFDPATIIDRATFDEPMAISEGVAAVFVNGACVWSGREASGALPGRVLRRSAATAH